MDKATIIQSSCKMKSRDDLLTLLNYIKKEKMIQLGCADKYHPFTQKHMNYYCNPNNAFHRYSSFKIKKKAGGERQISAPKHRSFMFMLRCLNELLKAVYTPSESAMGFAEGRSVIDNARKHRHMNYVLNLDLKDFFPSIEQARLWKRLQVKPFNFPVDVASAIAGLCCMKTSSKDENGKKSIHYILPQGAPTSPIVTNMICDKLDHRLSGVAKRFGVNYSRYADDISFSSMHNVYKKDGDFIKEVNRIIVDQGFTINENKTRLQKVGSHQEVTGITVNEKLNVSQKYVRDLRNILFIWKKYGYNVVFNRFISKYIAEKGHVKKGVPDLIGILKGKIMFLRMVKGGDDSVYKRLNNQFMRMSAALYNPTKTTPQGVTYLDTTSVSKFEKRFSTEICIVSKNIRDTKTKNDNVSQKDSHRYAFFVLEGKKIMASVNKSLTAEDISKKDGLAVSSCRSKDGTPFWLIHKIDKVTVPPPPKVNIDKLIKDLNSILEEINGRKT